MAKLSRYVGARPFETEQQAIFKGRTADTEALFRLIQLEPLVVLYGKSGTGKSSLLNAGLIPKVSAESEYVPLRVRFRAYKEGEPFTPPADCSCETVRGGKAAHTTFLDKLIADERSLWHDVKEHSIRHEQRGLLLVFDQFEELFTYPPEHVAAFQEQLAEALFKTVPQRYWDALERRYSVGERPLDAAQLALFQRKHLLKVVLSIRSDRLHLLNRLDAHLPTILKNCYELDALSEATAKEAIVEPALLEYGVGNAEYGILHAVPRTPHSELRTPNSVFDTPPFTFSDTALAQILDFLTHEKKSESAVADSDTAPVKQKIEATQLQIICASIEQRVAKQRLTHVRPEDLGDLEAIIGNYYDEKIGGLDPDEQLPARRLIEEGLVFQESEDRGIRLSLYEAQIRQLYKVSPETLAKLVDSHLLRAEPNLNGGYTYELSHDTLVAPVLKAKTLRTAEEERLRQEKERRDREIQLAQAQAEAARERRRRQRANVLAVLALAGLLVALVAGWWALGQKQVAENANTEANLKLLEALRERQQRFHLQLEQHALALAVYQTAEDTVLLQETSQAMRTLDSLIRQNETDIERAEKSVDKK